MKTTILLLENHDDIISIRDRLAWVKTPRVLLVLPSPNRLQLRPLDLTLLLRHARGMGAELGLVTRDGEIRAAAASLGIPVFKNAAEAQKKPWQTPLSLRASRPARRPWQVLRQNRPPADPLDVRDDPLARLGIFALGVLAVFVLLLALLPSARVQIRLPEQTQSLRLAVSAEEGAKTVQLSGVIPLYSRRITLQGSDSLPVSGEMLQPHAAAIGTVSITNQTESPISLPVGTTLLAQTDPPVRFLTVTEAEIVPGAKPTEVRVRAAEAGKGGNLPAGSIDAFLGELGLFLSVTNPQPISGGADRAVRAPSEADRAALRDRLLTRLQEQAREELGGGAFAFANTLRPVAILEELYSPPAGQAGENLSLTMQVEFALFYAREEEINQLAALALDASLPPGAEAIPGSLGVQPLSSFFGGEGVVRWQMQASRALRPQLDESEVIALVQGKTARHAAEILQQMLGLAEPPQISIRPVWWLWLPFLPSQIDVET